MKRSTEVVTISFDLPNWDDSTRETVIAYWASRGFKIRETSPYTLVGRRGNLIGNLFSFDMKNLMATLAVSWDDYEKSVHASFVVNTVMQLITEWNLEYWKLEMDSFQKLLKTGDRNLRAWEKFVPAYNRANLWWHFQFMFRAQVIEPWERTWNDID